VPPEFIAFQRDLTLPEVDRGTFFQTLQTQFLTVIGKLFLAFFAPKRTMIRVFRNCRKKSLQDFSGRVILRPCQAPSAPPFRPLLPDSERPFSPLFPGIVFCTLRSQNVRSALL
jgi:hypothetical protein